MEGWKDEGMVAWGDMGPWSHAHRNRVTHGIISELTLLVYESIYMRSATRLCVGRLNNATLCMNLPGLCSSFRFSGIPKIVHHRGRRVNLCEI